MSSGLLLIALACLSLVFYCLALTSQSLDYQFLLAKQTGLSSMQLDCKIISVSTNLYAIFSPL